MTRLARLAVPFLLLGLARCGSALPPFETVPLPAAPGESPEPRVSVCYNFLTASAEQVQGVAAASCSPGATPQPVARDVSLNYCPVLIPTRATFICAAPDATTARPGTP
jgi:hypothetical protein